MKDRAISAVLDNRGDDEDSSATRRSRIDEEFALLMTMCARAADVAPTPTLERPQVRGSGGGATSPAVARAVAENWRPVDGAVTSSAGAFDVAPTEKTSFTSEVVHQELGPMSVTVERKDGSVRVIFEVRDEIARVAVETQRAGLLSSLYGAGVKVASVTVAVKSGGTTIAQRTTATAKTKRSTSEASTESAGVGQSAPNPLNLVG